MLLLEVRQDAVRTHCGLLRTLLRAQNLRLLRHLRDYLQGLSLQLQE